MHLKMKNKINLIVLCFLLMLSVSACNFNQLQESLSNIESQKDNGDFSVHYIDVGQGDSELICMPDGEVMLIDTGLNETSYDLIHYINSKNINTIDYMVLTHPHEDHIGGTCKILDNFTVKNVYMPQVSENVMPTTRNYELILKSLLEKKINAVKAKSGMTIKNTSDINIQILAPNSEVYDNLNDFSIVIKLDYKNKSFLFMGDAEKKSEQEVISKFDVKADVLKCGHHGSYTSTNHEFLEKVKPEYAIVSCGKNNSYGHPHKQILKKLKDINAKVYRTDLNGTIVAEINTQGEIEIYFK